MDLDPRKLLRELFGGGAGKTSEAPAPITIPGELPEPAIPAIEMAGVLARTRDFLAGRRRLVSGLGWEGLARLPEWTGASRAEPSGTQVRISWSGVLGDLTGAVPVVGRMTAGTDALLRFVESRKSLYRHLTGSEELSLETLFPTRGAEGLGENVIGEATTASSAILRRLGEVWGQSSGEKPVSPQRIGKVTMRHPAPPAPRHAEPGLPWKDAGEGAGRAVSPVTGRYPWAIQF